ncbi:MAG: hypothetical protein K0R51_81 [Cytophagaceae bacterium]|jgi:hypothetical protein|nr:hypothetical protein [Cytophagaceae bacterium]
MTYIYLDWNVFNKIEKKDELDNQEKEAYQYIEELILNKKIITPYSNAHINDLVRGYEKNPGFISQHLATLKRLTKNLAVVQYWGDKQTTWHYRDVEEFFQSSLDDIETSTGSFSELLGWDQTGLWSVQLSLFRMQKLPEQFKELYRANPIFNKIFPKSKIEPNMLSLCEDLYDFSINAKKDYSLYKSLRNYVNQSRLKFKQQPQLFRGLDKSMAGIPSHLNYDKVWEEYSAKSKTSYNPIYQKITDTYCKIDFKGYKSDDKFSNLIDDSLHVFYAGHCEYFITIDDKCHYKANETYKELKISTIAIKPIEFMDKFKM